MENMGTKINETINIERVLITNDIKENVLLIKSRIYEMNLLKEKLRMLNSETFDLKSQNRKLRHELDLQKKYGNYNDIYKDKRRPSICRNSKDL